MTVFYVTLLSNIKSPTTPYYQEWHFTSMHCLVRKGLIHPGSPVKSGKIHSINIFWHIKVCLRLTAVVSEVYMLLGIHGTSWQLTGAVLSSASKRCEQVLLRCWHRLGSEYTECFYHACDAALLYILTVFYSNQHASTVTGNTNAHTFARNRGCSGSGFGFICGY